MKNLSVNDTMVFFESDLWLKQKFTHPMAVLDLMYLSSKQQEKIVWINNRHVVTEPGRVVTSIRILSIRWNVAPNTVQAWLENFRKDGFIEMERSNQCTIIKVNYSLRITKTGGPETADDIIGKIESILLRSNFK